MVQGRVWVSNQGFHALASESSRTEGFVHRALMLVKYAGMTNLVQTLNAMLPPLIGIERNACAHGFVQTML